MNRRERLHFFVIIIVCCVLIIIDLGRTFAYFVDPNTGEIITSTFFGHQSLNGNYRINRIPFYDTDGDSVTLQVEGGTLEVNQSRFEKSGDGSGSSEPWSNSVVLVQNGATFTFNGGSVVTDGLYSNAIYVDGGRSTLNGTNIQTKKNYSSGIVTANNGTVNANYLVLETLGEYSSAISNLGGSIIVNGGSYKTSNNFSPVILARGDVSVSQSSTLVSEKSEGIVVDGNHTVTFNSSSLTTNNTSFYNGTNIGKSIMLFQSSDKDNNSVATFRASDSSLITNNGDTFYVTNTKASIKLEHNTILNSNGNFLRIESSNIGSSGSNGGDVELELFNQVVNGNILVDSLSKLEINMLNGSSFVGSINGNNQSSDVNLALSSDSSFTLSGDTYLSSLDNADATNSNIHLNGYDLYINGEKLVIGGSGTDTNNVNGGSGVDEGNNNSSNNSTDNHVDNGSGNIVTGGSSSQQGNGGTSSNNDSSSGTTKSSSDSSTKNSSDSSAKNSSDSSAKNSSDSSSGKKASSDDKKNSGTVGSSNKKNSKNGTNNVTDSKKDDEFKEYSVGNSSSIYVVDDKTLIIINAIGIILIIISTASLVKSIILKKVDEV